MRTRWQSADPERVVAWLDLVLGPPAVLALDSVFELGSGSIEIVAGAGPDRLTIAEAASEEARYARAFALVAVGIATVDTERYAKDAGWTVAPLPSDLILGAFAARVAGEPLVLLEPNTEGRLVASLVRFAEGPCAIYVHPVGSSLESVRSAISARGGTTTTVSAGPFGPEIALAGRPAWGPHLLIVASDESAAGTIAP
jgi:hypothetical protein